jgi:hypothetical protein
LFLTKRNWNNKKTKRNKELFLHSSNEILLSSDNLLYSQPGLVADPLDIVPAEVTEDLYDGVDQGLLSVMVGPIDISLINTQHKIVKQRTISWAGRPEEWEVNPAPVLGQFGGRHSFLLQDTGPPCSHLGWKGNFAKI